MIGLMAELGRPLRVEAVWKLDVYVVVRKVDLSDRPRIDDRHRGRGSMTTEIARRQSFHTASVGTVSPYIGEAVGGAAPAASRTPYDRSTLYSRHSGQRRSLCPTAASWQ